MIISVEALLFEILTLYYYSFVLKVTIVADYFVELILGIKFLALELMFCCEVLGIIICKRVFRLGRGCTVKTIE